MCSDPLYGGERPQQSETLRCEAVRAWASTLFLAAALLFCASGARADSLDEAAELTKAQLETLIAEGSQCTSSMASCPAMATCTMTPECTAFADDFELGAPVWREVWVAAEGTAHFDEIGALLHTATGQMLSYVLYTSSAVCGKVACPSVSHAGLMALCDHGWPSSECHSALGAE